MINTCGFLLLPLALSMLALPVEGASRETSCRQRSCGELTDEIEVSFPGNGDELDDDRPAGLEEAVIRQGPNGQYYVTGFERDPKGNRVSRHVKMSAEEVEQMEESRRRRERRDRERSTRYESSLECIAELKCHYALDTLVEHYRGSHSVKVASTVAVLDMDAGLKMLRETLTEDRHRAAALAALAEIPGEEVSGEIFSLISDGEPEIRAGAVWALGRRPHRESGRSLLELLGEQDRCVVGWTLSAIEGQIVRGDWLFNDEDEDLKDFLVTTVGERAGPTTCSEFNGEQLIFTPKKGEWDPPSFSYRAADLLVKYLTAQGEATGIAGGLSEEEGNSLAGLMGDPSADLCTRARIAEILLGTGRREDVDSAVGEGNREDLADVYFIPILSGSEESIPALIETLEGQGTLDMYNIFSLCGNDRLAAAASEWEAEYERRQGSDLSPRGPCSVPWGGAKPQD